MASILGDQEVLLKLGKGIQSERLRRNLPQAHLASVAGISLPTYRKIEKGDGRIEFRHVVKVLAIFGFSEALGNLIPSTPPEIRLKDLLAPQRKHASRVKVDGKAS